MMMTILISRTELARNTRKTIEQARRIGPVVVESYGEQQAAVLDIIDYRLLRAVGSWEPDMSAPFSNPDAQPRGLTADEIKINQSAAEEDPQALWNLVISAYLDLNISLGRSAELLGLSRFELQDRLNRLDLPIRLGPRSIADAELEFQALKS
jgi:hypothetical protein